MNKAPSTLLIALVGVMTSGAVLSYSLSSAGPEIIERVGITPGQLGGLASISFVTAAVISFGLGRVADRVSIRAQFALIHLLTLTALVVAAFAQDYWMLCLAAVLVGPPLAICNPTTNRVLLHSVPPEQRGSWVGIKQAGVQVAQFVVGLIFPAMVLAMGWVAAELVVAAAVVMLLVQGLIAVRAHDHPSATPVRKQPKGTGGLPTSVWLLAVISMLGGFGMQASSVYLPTFAVHTLGYRLTVGGLTAAVVGGVGVVARVFWGRMTRFVPRPSILFLLIFGGATASGVSFILATVTGIRTLLWVGAVLVGAATLGTNVVVNATIMQVVPVERVGTASGLTSMFMYLGFAAGPFVMGLLRDLSGSFAWGWATMTALYVGGFGVSLLLSTGGRTAEPSV